MSKKQIGRAFVLLLPLTVVLGVFVLNTKAAQEQNIQSPNQKIYQDQIPRVSAAEWTEKVKNEILPKLSGAVAEPLARNLGVPAIYGKKLRSSKPGATSPRSEMFNVPVGTDWWSHENEPSVSVNPQNDRWVIAFHHWSSGSYYYATVHISDDGGVSFWDYPLTMPNLNPAADTYADPVVRYTPDGYYAMLSYMEIDIATNTSDILCGVMDVYYGGYAFYGPFMIWDGINYGTLPDKPWIDVHRYDPSYGPVIDCTFTWFTPGDTYILYTGSTNYGGTWPGWAWIVIQSATEVNQGSRPIGRSGSYGTLVAWYNSGTDGWLTGKFNIMTRFYPSGIGGGGNTIVKAAASVPYECPYYLGPSGKYHRWWGTMFPSVDIGPDNRVFIAFSLDPSTTVSSAEDGDVYITYSTNATYTSWLARKKVGYGGTAAQGYPTIVTQRLSGGGYRVYLAWMNHDATSKNLYYDIYRMISLNKGGSWSSLKKVNDYRSISDYSFLGDYNDSSAHMRRPFVIWTDRSDKTSIYDYEDDVLLDRLDK